MSNVIFYLLGVVLAISINKTDIGTLKNRLAEKFNRDISNVEVFSVKFLLMVLWPLLSILIIINLVILITIKKGSNK